MTASNVIVLWRENDWRCELHSGTPGSCRLLVYRDDVVACAEAIVLGHTAHVRAEVLRRRVLRGNLSMPRKGDSESPDFT
jgi:hypothetical protein